MDFGRQYLAVSVVLALLGATLWWLRRRGYAARSGPGRGGPQLERLERLALSPQHTLYVVRAGDALLLLACSPGGCSMVRDLAPGRPAGGSR